MTYGRTKGQSISLLSEEDEVEARRWAEARFGRSLLVLGDLTTPLRHLARHWALYAQSTHKIRGLAVKFDGFEIPVASVVADDENVAASLLALLGDLNGLLVVNSEQDLPISIRHRTESTDPWMVALCEGSTIPGLENAEPVLDAAEVEEFLQRLGTRFWCPAMFRFGHTFGVRSANGRLICVGGVNFVLEDMRYAHIGPLVTDPAERGRSFGSQVLAAVRSSLASVGIRYCGLFADGADPGLIRYYVRRGFSSRGGFHFVKT